MSTLYDLIEDADAIEIDGYFVRHLNVISVDEIKDDNDIALDVQMIDDDYNGLEWQFTVAELKAAEYDGEETDDWTVYSGDDAYTVTIYKVNPIKNIG